jgi:perosamine synthetase
MDEIAAIAAQYQLRLSRTPLTPAPAAYRASPLEARSRPVCGRWRVFSFYATKTLATGEGGMVTTDDERAPSASG